MYSHSPHKWRLRKIISHPHLDISGAAILDISGCAISGEINQQFLRLAKFPPNCDWLHSLLSPCVFCGLPTEWRTFLNHHFQYPNHNCHHHHHHHCHDFVQPDNTYALCKRVSSTFWKGATLNFHTFDIPVCWWIKPGLHKKARDDESDVAGT